MQNEICNQCHELVRAGDLEGLLRAREAGCPWGQEAGFLQHRYLCTYPASKGDLVTLQWLWTQGCPEPYWQHVIGCAVERGQTEVVSWACAQGLPTSEAALFSAVLHGNLQALVSMVDSGAKWDPEMCLRVANSFGHAELAAWIEWWISPQEIKEPGEA